MSKTLGTVCLISRLDTPTIFQREGHVSNTVLIRQQFKVLEHDAILRRSIGMSLSFNCRNQCADDILPLVGRSSLVNISAAWSCRAALAHHDHEFFWIYMQTNPIERGVELRAYFFVTLSSNIINCYYSIS